MSIQLAWSDRILRAAVILAYILAPVSGMATEPSVNEQLLPAAKKGDLDRVKTLLAQGADVNAKDLCGLTALMDAAAGGIGRCHLGGYLTYWYYADNREKYLKFVKFLVDHGADVKTRDKFDDTALIGAAGAGNLEAVKLLVDRGADVNVKDKYGRTPLSSASAKGETAVVQYLKSLGAK